MALPAVPRQSHQRPQDSGQRPQGHQMNQWLQGNSGVHDRLAQTQYSHASYLSGTRRHGHGPPVDTSSCQQWQSATSATAGRSGHSVHSAGSSVSTPPSLSYSPQSDSSSSQWSVPTNPYNPTPNVDHIDSNGNIVRAPQTQYTCLFVFLGCDWHGTSPHEWHTHCNSHIYRCGAPKNFTCPQCGEHRTGRHAWTEGLGHVQQHFSQGRRLEYRYQDKYLYKHMWDARAIPDAQYRILTEPTAFDKNQITTSHDPHRHRRHP